MPGKYTHHCIFTFLKDVYIIFTLAQAEQSASRAPLSLTPCVAGLCWKNLIY